MVVCFLFVLGFFRSLIHQVFWFFLNSVNSNLLFLKPKLYLEFVEKGIRNVEILR